VVTRENAFIGLYPRTIGKKQSLGIDLETKEQKGKDKRMLELEG